MLLKTNHTISVDCILFGYDGIRLKVLLAKYSSMVFQRKLPGRMIFENESLDTSAKKIVNKILGNNNVSLKQMHIFSDPNRVSKEELSWINKRYDIVTDRVVTVAYYGVVRLTNYIIANTDDKIYSWVDIDDIRALPMDHMNILVMAISHLHREVFYSPIVFDLLPKKFTVKQIQKVYEEILGVELDNRNFRKKIMHYLISTGEYEQKVSHKPAEYFMCNKKIVAAHIKKGERLYCINNWK